jgi:hypothetical protein
VTIWNAAGHLEQPRRRLRLRPPRLGIVREVTGRSRNKLFVYSGYLELLEEGMTS